MIRRLCLAVLLTVSLGVAPSAAAPQPDELLDDPVLEERARDLSAKLRCMVCQNQSIDDSDAPLARDLRILVRERLVAGDSDDEVISFLVDRYGEFVLLNPRFGMHTALLWGAPVGLLLFGGVLVAVFLRNRRRPELQPVPLDAAEQARLDALLKDDARG